MSENFFKTRGRDGNKNSIQSKVNRESREGPGGQRQKPKVFGPYRIKNISGIEGVGIDPMRPEHSNGVWFIGELEGDNTFWTRVDNDTFTEDRMDSVGILEENYVGRLFYVKALSSSPLDLSRGKAYLMDDYGTPEVDGYPDVKRPNKFPFTVATNIASICGPFSFKMPNLDIVMSKLNKGD